MHDVHEAAGELLLFYVCIKEKKGFSASLFLFSLQYLFWQVPLVEAAMMNWFIKLFIINLIIYVVACHNHAETSYLFYF